MTTLKKGPHLSTHTGSYFSQKVRSDDRNTEDVSDPVRGSDLATRSWNRRTLSKTNRIDSTTPHPGKGFLRPN